MNLLQVCLQNFLCFKLFICPFALKRQKLFQVFTPKLPPMFHHEALDLETQPAFYNIQKLDLCSKTEVSKTAWINAWTEYC